MPVLLDLGAFAAAGLCLLASIALVYIVKAISSALPNLSILGVGLDLAKMFRDAGDTVMSWAVNNTKHLWDAVTGWLLHHAYMLEQFAGSVVQAVGTLDTKIEHLFTTAIPNAIHTAEQAAAKFTTQEIHTVEHAIAGARASIETSLSKEARSLYIKAAHEVASIEHDVTSSVAHAVDHAEAFTTHEIHVLHGDLTQAIADAVSTVRGEINTLKQDLTRSIASLAKTVDTDYHNALAAAQSDAAAALSTAKGLIGDAVTEVEKYADADAAKVQQLLQAAIDTTNQTVTQLTGTVASDLNQAEQYAQAQVAAGLNDVTQALSGAAETVGGAIGSAAASAAGAVSGIEGQLQQDISTALGDAQAAVGSALAGVYQDITGQALSYNGDISTIEGALAGAITGSIAGVLTRVAKLEECSVGVCSDSPNNFSNLLQQALGIASLVGVGGFLKQAIYQPEQTAQLVAGPAAGLESEAETLLEQLLKL